jgi:hypothetical protein
MYLNYRSNIKKSLFSVTDFNCSEYQQLLKITRFYKVIWAREDGINLTVDGYILDLIDTMYRSLH